MEEKMKIKKEPLKTRNPRIYYRNAYYAAQSAEWAACLLPMVAIFGAKWNEYFDFAANDGSAVKLSIGCILAVVCSAVFMYKKARHQEKVEKKASMFTYVLSIGVAFAFAYFFKAIIDDLLLILGCELAGAATAFGIDISVTQEMRRKQILYRDAHDKLDAEEAALKERDVRLVGRRRR